MSDRTTSSSVQSGVHQRSGTVAYNPGQAPGNAAFGTDASGATVQTTLQNYIAPSVPAPSVPRTAPPESPAQSRPSFNKDVPANYRLDVLLAVNDTLQAKMGAKIEEVMHELEADSPPRSKRPKPEAADGPPTLRRPPWRRETQTIPSSSLRPARRSVFSTLPKSNTKAKGL